MRPEPNLLIDRYRRRHPTLGGSEPGANWGYFEVSMPRGELRVIASGRDERNGWEHVSVSLPDRCPSWNEMTKVKELFWRDDETVIQFHPRSDAHINHHPFCLHLWKRVGTEYQLPPAGLIA